MSKPLLSIGMIVKNEERCLEKCLKALEPLRQAIPCELVIADTGSIDKSRKIAEKYADILFDFEWVNDFSVARNAVMDRCSGKWYLTLDADEYLVPNIDELVTFLTGKNADKMQQATIIIRNHFEKSMDGTYSDFNAMRMCRLNAGIRYTSPIHEHFNKTLTYDDIYVLTNTLFDHDGYANISPEYKAKKDARNLELLEKKLETEPDNLLVILQCLESSTTNTQKRRFFTKHAISKLLKATPEDIFWDSTGANLAKQIALYLNFDNDPYQDDWFDWTFKTFPKSLHTTLDTNYIYTKYLFSKENYIKTIKTGKAYLKNYDKLNIKSNTASLQQFTSHYLYAHEIHKNEIKTLIANAMLKTSDEDHAIKLLTETNLYKQSKTVINNWFAAVIELEKNTENIEQISKYISSLLEKYSSEKHSSYDYILSRISLLFKADSEKKHFELLENVPGTIGLSVKIANANTKESAEKILNKVENWELFMPIALKNALLLKAQFPKEFFTSAPNRNKFLISSLNNSSKEIIEVLTDDFCNTEHRYEFPYTSFIFKLLLNMLLNNSQALNSELKITLINAFLKIAKIYLNSCYNSELLENEKYITCISTPHLFAWYLVKANNLKETNSLEYVKTLRVLLNKIPESKQVVEFLIEEFQKEESNKKQEQIKNASPELIAMAEQLKTMLAAFPENSPELLAIKQSPVYKQVAFLIED